MDGPPAEFRLGDPVPLPELKRWLGGCGERVVVYRGCRIIHPERVIIGDSSQIDEGVKIFGGMGVTIGKHTHLAFDCSISGGGECVIHDFAGIGAGVRLITGSEVVDQGGLTNPTVPPELRTVRRGRIEIGAHAVIFTNSIILPNVVVGAGAVVAAGSIVHHDLEPWTIYAGHPLVPVRVRVRVRSEE